MTILSDRWPGFGRLPHVRLAELPTAVEPLESLGHRLGAQLWVKRDDGTSRRYGGNKVRKLEYTLGEALAREADTLITCGGGGSHHALATTRFASELGLQVHVVAFPQPWTAHAEANLRAILALGGEVHPVRTSVAVTPRMRALAARERLRRRRPFLLPAGGSSVAGVIGHVEAGLELARQIESAVLPEPDALFVALGTGGTLAGLAVGLAAAGVTTRLVGVRVLPWLQIRRGHVRRLIRRTVRRLRALDGRFPDVAETAHERVVVDGAELGRGYGVETPVGRSASRLALRHGGLRLDPTYTSKAFAGLIRHAQGERAGQRLLYVHTLSATPGAEGTRHPLPRSLRRLLRR